MEELRPRRANVGPAKPTKESGAGGPKRRPERQQDRKVLDLLRRHSGASARELLKATGWQPQFTSRIQKMGLALTSTKGEDGERVYALKA